MLNDTLSRSDVAQLLEESGCSQEFTQQFLVTMDTQGISEQLKLLRMQRTKQLGLVHREEKKLDQLDFLRYKLEKQLSATEPSPRANRGC